MIKIHHHFAVSTAWLTLVTMFAGCCCCSAPEPPSNGVQVQVNVSNLSDAEIEDLKSKLADIAGNDSNVSTVINGAATWNYTTDLEPQAFADKIDFATVTGVEDRVIKLKVSDTSSGDGAAEGTADDAGTDDGAAADDGTTTDDGATAEDGTSPADDGASTDGANPDGAESTDGATSDG